MMWGAPKVDAARVSEQVPNVSMASLPILPSIVGAYAAAWVLVWVFASLPGSRASKRVVSIQKKWLQGITYMIMCKDTRSIKKTSFTDAAVTDLDDPGPKRKTVLFMRHGESFWNEVFNRGFGPGFVYRLVFGALKEIQRMTYGDSLFLDSPLSTEGEAQVNELCEFLRAELTHGGKGGVLSKSNELLQTMKTDFKGCKVVSSNLRRAMCTAAIALRDRLALSKEKIQIVPHLQVSTPSIAEKTPLDLPNRPVR